MTQKSPSDIVNDALVRDQVVSLLLGKPEFCYLPPRSPSPWNSDLAALLNVLYENNDSYTRHERRDRLCRALKEISGKYEGVIPMALCVVFEAFRQSTNRSPLGLPLEEIVADLKDAICKFEVQLIQDKSGPGWQWQDGLLGELRLLSKNTADFGGPAFYADRFHN